MTLIITSDSSMLSKLEEVLGECGFHVEIVRAYSVEEAVVITCSRTVDCFIVVEQRVKNGLLSGIKFIDSIRKTDIYRFTPIIYISAIPDPFGKVSNTYQLFAYLDRGFDPALSRDIFHTAASHRTRKENLRLGVCVEGVTHLVRTDEIEYISSQGHSFIIGCTNHKRLHAKGFDNLDCLMNHLDSSDFVRCSKSSLCNLKHVEWMDNSNMFIGLGSGERLKVGRIYKKQLVERLIRKL